jgi:glycosyltransferase involved in cell wall biosynthesis
MQPEIEAVSKEVFQLAAHFRGSFLFGVSPHYSVCGSLRNRFIGFHPQFYPFLRLVIPTIEKFCDINHVYGDASPWTFYKSLRSKPLVITVASELGLPQIDFLARARKIFVQTNSFYRKLIALGTEQEKVELLYPGVDLKRFRPRTDTLHRKGRPKLLFATAPRSEAEMTRRGVYLLLDAAKLSPDVQFHLLYREWNSGYTSLAATKRWLELTRLDNVTLTNSVVADMSSLYCDYNFTVIPYTTSDGGKECPTSAVEGLACGLPALISSQAPFAEFVVEHNCGIVFDPTPSSLVAAVEAGMRQYGKLSTNAVKVAHKHFSLQRSLQRIAQLYRDILN